MEELFPGNVILIPLAPSECLFVIDCDKQALIGCQSGHNSISRYFIQRIRETQIFGFLPNQMIHCVNWSNSRSKSFGSEGIFF